MAMASNGSNGSGGGKKKGRKKPPPGTAQMPVLVPRPNGKGALLSGGIPGNSGGKPGRSGPKPSVVKSLAASKLPKHVETLDRIAKGEVVVTLVGKCEKCGHIGERTNEPPVRASERVRAIEVLKDFADTADLIVTNENAGTFLECIDRALSELVEPYVIDQVHERSRELFKQSRKSA
jgi:hypothetical protein